MRVKSKVYSLIMATTIALSSCSLSDTRWVPTHYPTARLDTTIIDQYFGQQVADPYRWLENDTSVETSEWVNAQRQLTQEYFSHISFRDTYKQRLEQLYNYERVSYPTYSGGRYFFSKNNGLQNQSVIYTQENLEDSPEVFLDPNKLSEDGTVAYAGMSLSKDGKYAAYCIHRNGSDWTEIYVMDVKTRQLCEDHIKWAKFTGAEWHGNGFYYAAYDAPNAHAYSGKNENHKIYYHTIGTPQSEDILVYENKKKPLYFHSISLSRDEQYIFLMESGQGAGNTLAVRKATDKHGKFTSMAQDMNYFYYPLEVIDGNIYIYTNYQAPKGRLCIAPVSHPEKESWRDLISESKHVISDITFADGHIIVTYDKDAAHHAFVYTMEGKICHEIELPTFGSVAFSARYDRNEIFYSFTSFVYPTTIFRYNIVENKSSVYIAPQTNFKPSEYTTEQVFVTSSDGTKFPIFITYKNGLERNRKNPTLLYGYGGFGVSLNPYFSPVRIAFLEQGGIYVQATLRGGNEYGEEWHQAGTKLRKQNVFDDFISAAEWLIAEGYTSSRYLAINGGSNGGLLVGACVNQRPDLYAVAIPQVGVMDMLRYHKFTIGWNWASDYGTSEESPEMFSYLKAYSPLHNIRSGSNYPAILITTADHDDRVVPAHSFKYAATLQAAETGTQPKLIMIESNAGHGSGKPMSKVLEEQANIYSFIFHNMGIKPKEFK